jgi:hypothetical protein
MNFEGTIKIKSDVGKISKPTITAPSSFEKRKTTVNEK